MAEKGGKTINNNKFLCKDSPLSDHPLSKISFIILFIGIFSLQLTMILVLIFNQFFFSFLFVISTVIIIISFIFLISTGSLFQTRNLILLMGWILTVGGFFIILPTLIQKKTIFALADDVFISIFIILFTFLWGISILVTYYLKYFGYFPKSFSQIGNIIDYDPFVCSNCGGGPLKSLNNNYMFECTKCHYKYYKGIHYKN